jgi:signal transduction histidine kinase/ActR/RegA family two-component response regulator
LAPSGTGPQLAEIRALIDPADRGAVRAEFRRTLKEPEHRFAAEYTVRPADGRARRLLSRGQAIRDQQGTVLRVVGITLDVTARFEAEKARDRLIGLLQEERGRLSEIIEALPVGVGIVGPSRRFTLSNALMRRYLGPQAPDASSPERACWTGRDAGGNPLPADEYPVAKALRGEATLPGQEFLHTAADGVTTWFRVACLPLRPADGIGGGTIQEVLLVLQNIDAERRLVDLERRANARLEQRVREEVSAREAAQQRAAQAERVQALGQIAGGIAHDFNNVLQAVTGGAALIERRLDQPDRVLRHVRMIADAARRGAAITSRLLAFARRGDLRAEIVDPAALLSDMADVLSHTLGGSVCCQVDAPSGLPPLFADRGQLETVLVNLATNARDAMANGGTLTLSARSETAGYDHVSDTGAPPDLPPGDYVRISVTDTGAGMSPSVLARVSEPFFTTKEPGKGTGLGLAMAKGFVEQSGGRLAIDSTEGKGTTVHLWLPQAPRGASGLAHQKTSTESRSLVPLVLLADDDPIVRTVLADSLEDAGFTVLVAESGQAALDLLRRQPRLDALVTDLTMPGMDGLTLIREVQALRPGLPAVLLTGYAGDGAALAIGGAISGTFSLLRKPVTGVQLVDRITSLLEGSPTPLAH